MRSRGLGKNVLFSSHQMAGKAGVSDKWVSVLIAVKGGVKVQRKWRQNMVKIRGGEAFRWRTGM